ncbi:MAG TPA: signal peptidase I [Candidatus Mediterraneibacter intestinipullorum]|nr:signal peptidase I [Candidatus Mediterraneibacter intestinipullorum]
MRNLFYRNKDPSRISGGEKEKSPEEAGKPREREKKKGLFWDVVFYLSLIALVAGVLLVKSGGNGAPVSIGGFSIHTVLTSSMEDELPQGTLVVTRQVDPASLQIGDDITYMRDETTTVTHRIVGIIEDYDGTGQRAFETRGTMNKEKDRLPVPAANVVGKVVFHNDVLGHIMSFLSRFWHLLLLFLLLFAGLIWSVQSWRKAGKEEAAEQGGITAPHSSGPDRTRRKAKPVNKNRKENQHDKEQTQGVRRSIRSDAGRGHRPDRHVRVAVHEPDGQKRSPGKRAQPRRTAARRLQRRDEKSVR